MKKFEIDHSDPDRNKCEESACKYEKKRDDSNGCEWEQCTRCGRTRNLSYPV